MFHEEAAEAVEYEELTKAIAEMPHEAPCENYPDAFYAEYKDGDYFYTVEAAKQLCAGCPIKAQCAAYGLRWEEFGIWGGMTPAERTKFRKKFMKSGATFPIAQRRSEAPNAEIA